LVQLAEASNITIKYSAIRTTAQCDQLLPSQSQTISPQMASHTFSTPPELKPISDRQNKSQTTIQQHSILHRINDSNDNIRSSLLQIKCGYLLFHCTPPRGYYCSIVLWSEQFDNTWLWCCTTLQWCCERVNLPTFPRLDQAMQYVVTKHTWLHTILINKNNQN